MIKVRTVSLLLIMLSSIRVQSSCGKFPFNKVLSQSLSTSVSRSSHATQNQCSSTIKPNVIFVLGGPGAGKGTQCEKLSSEFGLIHLSAGQLLREEQLKPTEHGRLIDLYLKEGKIVPVAISLSLLKQAIVKYQWNRYLIDGFPRNWDNLEGWNKEMSTVCNLESVLFIECHESNLERRILSRGVSSGRDDDNLESARKRFATFKAETMPVVDYFRRELGEKVVTVSGDGSVDEVYAPLRRTVERNIEREIVELTGRLLEKEAVDGCQEITHHQVTVHGQTATIKYKSSTTTNGQAEEGPWAERTWQFENGHWR